MKIYAMSDIHGHLQEFEEALSKVDLSKDNMLILLGDYIHGPDSYGVLEKTIKLQEEYGSEKVIALLGNHEEMALNGFAPICENEEDFDEAKEDEYLGWMCNLPLYHVVENAIFVHAGIDEDSASEGDWEWETTERTYTTKFPADIGKIKEFDMKIVAGHIGTCEISDDEHYHDIYFDGGSHYYIDGTVEKSGEIPVIMYETYRNEFYRVGEGGNWLILPYDEEN